jgi:hypothetical protein
VYKEDEERYERCNMAETEKAEDEEISKILLMLYLLT